MSLEGASEDLEEVVFRALVLASNTALHLTMVALLTEMQVY